MPVPETFDELFELIRDDVASALAEPFPGDLDIPGELRELLPIGTGRSTAVPWVWRGSHQGVFHDVRPTAQGVEIAGITILRDDGDELRYHRVVDWQTLYRQLGLLMVCRRPRDPNVDDVDDVDYRLVPP
jgi:hypothetical protein